MLIKSIEFLGLSAPLAPGKSYGMSKSLATGRQSTLVRLRLDNGITGYGEAWGWPQFNQGYHELLRNYLVGTHVLDIEHVFDQIVARHYHFGLQNAMMACISGIDIAARDAAGKALDLPVCRLLGGSRLDAVPFYASGGYLTDTPQADFTPQIDHMAAAGYRNVKIKLGLNPASDEERLTIARQRLGEDVQILVDINTNYTFDLARESMQRMAPMRPGWVEEPLSPRDLAGLERLHQIAPSPIATGEALYCVHDFLPIAGAGSADILQPDLTLCGGFWQARKIAELAYVHHLRVSPHVWGGAVGLAAALHFIASLSIHPHSNNIPEPVLLEYDLGENPLRSDILRAPILPDGDVIRIPTGPGLGIEIDEDKLQHYAL